MNLNRDIEEALAPQKGLPRFRYRNIEEELADARVSVRRWWWEYLRLSKDYWLVCQTSRSSLRPETTDYELARIFRKFGDIYSQSFDDWYVSRGSRIFREQHEPPKVREISATAAMSRNRQGKILIEVPLVLSRNTIQRQISRILKQYEDERPDNRLEISQSEFPINPVRYRLHTLQVMHEVYCLHRELIDKPAALRELAQQADQRKEWQQRYERRADLYRIGKLLRISPSNERLTGDAQEIRAKQNRMRATVSRFMRRAEQLIGNVEHGRYPVFAAYARPHDRFSAKQLALHQELEAQWWTLDLNSELSGDKVPLVTSLYYSEAGNDFV